MYLPPIFRSDDARLAAEVIRCHPLASLITVDDDNLPFVSHLPLHLEQTESNGHWRLLGHCARANPQWRHLAARPRAVVTFLGPQAYLSPSVYPDRQRVPTWNYVAVHCTVQARLVDEPDAKDALLKRLIGDHEPAYAEQWRGLDASYASRMLGAIVGMALEVTELQCKLKLNQHRPEALAAMREQYAAAGEQGQALLRWLDRVAPPPQA